MRLGPSVAFALAASLGASRASASLEEDAARASEFFTSHGATIERPAPVFVERGKTRVLSIDASRGAARCATLALISARTVEITGASVTIAGAGDEQRSAAGVLLMSRCGPDRKQLDRVALAVTSARGAVEIVLARSEEPIANATLDEALPERALGTSAPRGNAGGPLEPGPLPERVAAAARRARDAGATIVTTVSMNAGAAGTGELDVKLLAGCHRIDLMAAVPTTFPHRATDLDAEARADGRVLARDRAEVPDVRLDFCLGEDTEVEIPFMGASGEVRVTLSDALFPIAATVPQRFGARARAGFGWALHRRHAPPPPDAPMLETLGVQGLSVVPLEVEPGRCYLATIAILRGDPRALRVGVAVGPRIARDDAIEKPDGAAVAFCTTTERRALLEVDARGRSIWWAGALFEMGPGAR